MLDAAALCYKNAQLRRTAGTRSLIMHALAGGLRETSFPPALRAMLIDISTMLVVLAASSLLMAFALWLAFP